MTDRPLTKNSPGRNVSDPLVSVIIPHYNDLANLRRCLGRLASQTLPKDRFEIVVADNGSACGLEEVQNVCGRIARVVHAPIPGAGPARNVAVAASSGAVLAFTDSDCRPAPDWLENGLAALRNADIVGGRVDVDVGDPAHPTAIEAFELVFAFNVKRYIAELGFSVSANIFVSRATFDRVGAFRARVVEDLDWGTELPPPIVDGGTPPTSSSLIPRAARGRNSGRSGGDAPQKISRWPMNGDTERRSGFSVASRSFFRRSSIGLLCSGRTSWRAPSSG